MPRCSKPFDALRQRTWNLQSFPVSQVFLETCRELCAMYVPQHLRSSQCRICDSVFGCSDHFNAVSSHLYTNSWVLLLPVLVYIIDINQSWKAGAFDFDALADSNVDVGVDLMNRASGFLYFWITWPDVNAFTLVKIWVRVVLHVHCVYIFPLSHTLYWACQCMKLDFVKTIWTARPL
jgi:hypothetical protein